MITNIALIFCVIVLVVQFYKNRNAANLIMAIFFGAFVACNILGGFNIWVIAISLFLLFLVFRKIG